MKFLKAFLLFSILFSCNLEAGVLSASVDRTAINNDETLILTVQYDEHTNEEPDTRELEQQFSILSLNNTSNIQMTNGTTSINTIWHYEIAPRKSGALSIPGFNIEGNTSEPIDITVNENTDQKSDANQETFYTETILDKERVFVQEQVIVSWRLVSRKGFGQMPFSIPKIDGLLTQALGSRTYTRIGNDGGTESIVEHSYALFPQQSGNIVIPAQQFQVITETKRRTTMGFILIERKPTPFNTSEKLLEVIPANNPENTDWLPASYLEISQEISDTDPNDQATAGTAFYRTIRIRAQGLSAEQLPTPDLTANGIKVYSETPVFSNNDNQQGVVGLREDRAAIIATQPGKLVLPAIKVPWYDVNNHQWQEAVLPETTITVLPNPISDASTIDNTAPIISTPIEKPINPLKTTNEIQWTVNTSDLWKFFAAAIIVFIFIIAIYLYRSHKIQKSQLDTLYR